MPPLPCLPTRCSHYVTIQTGSAAWRSSALPSAGTGSFPDLSAGAAGDDDRPRLIPAGPGSARPTGRVKPLLTRRVVGCCLDGSRR